MKRILSLILALMLVLSCFSALGESFASDYAAMNEAAASVLVLTLYDENDKELGTASGFIAFDESHAVTTWLAVSSAARIAIETDEGEKLGSFKVLGCDSDCNLAILAFDEPTGLKPLALNQTGNVRRGAACVSIGAQNGVNSITTGHVATTFSVQGLDLIQFTATISEGSSGGALLDENGQVAAVTMFGISGEIGYTVLQNMNFALSVSHLMTLWEFCKNDEPVEMKEWGITDIGVDSSYNGAPKGFTIINDTGYKLSSLRIKAVDKRGGRYEALKTLALNWVEKGSAIEFELDADTELTADNYVEFNIEYSGSYGKGTISRRYTDTNSLYGKTFSLSVNLGAGTMLLTEIESNSDQLERRHLKESTDTGDDFEIPETIKRERKIAKNTCLIVNNTDYVMTGITLFNIEAYKQYVLSKEEVPPGKYCLVELPEELINNNGKYSWRLSVYLQDRRSRYDTQMHTKDQSVYCGGVIFAQMNEKTRQTYLEVQ